MTTRETVIRLAQETQAMMITGSELPEGGFDGLLRQLANENVLDREFRAAHPGADTGMDAWGKKVVCEVCGDVIHFRSVGPNGVDEGGHGDDIDAFVKYKDVRSGVQVVGDQL